MTFCVKTVSDNPNSRLNTITRYRYLVSPLDNNNILHQDTNTILLLWRFCNSNNNVIRLRIYYFLVSKNTYQTVGGYLFFYFYGKHILFLTRDGRTESTRQFERYICITQCIIYMKKTIILRVLYIGRYSFDTQ